MLNGADGDVVLGSPDASAIIAAPDSVKAWRTVGSLNHENARPEDYYVKTGKGIMLSKSLSARIGKAVLEKDTYADPHEDPNELPRPGKACFPEPGVVLTFYKDNHFVDVYFCFQCNIMIVNSVWDPKKSPELTGGQVDFDFGRAKLLRIIKDVFPKDKEIQSLKNKV